MHTIKFVDDDALPAGHDFVFVEASDDKMLFLRASAVTAEVLEQAWAALRALEAPRPTPGLRHAS